MVGVRSRDNTGGCLFAWHTAEPIYARSSSSSSNFPLDHMELRGGGLSQAWKSDKPSTVRQVHAGPACTRMGTQEVQPAWHGPAEQGTTAGGRLGAQTAGPQEAKVATRKPPRPTEPWDSSTSNNPPSGPPGWGQAEPAGYIALWARAGRASPSSSVEAGTYRRTQHEAHSLMTVMGLGEPRRVSLRRLQLGRHVAHCEVRGFFFELLKKKKKLISFSSFPTCLGLPCCPLAGS